MAATNIAQLAENIKSSVEDLFSSEKRGGQHAVGGAIDRVLSFIDPSKWMGSKDPLYSFQVISVTGNLDPKAGVLAAPAGWDEFPLPLSPTEINQDENFAIMIRPTQGGTAVKHSGNRYKDLTISGTTGIHPFKGSGGALSDGTAVLQPKDLKHQSGYYVFLQLRNWFRAYYEQKASEKESAKNMRLIFKNYKDGEFLMVELVKFSMRRSAGRPHMYDYVLNFKVIGVMKFVERETDFLRDLDKTIQDAVDYIDTARGVFLRSQEILRQVEANAEAIAVEPLRKIGLVAKSAIGVGNVASDMSSQLIRNTVTSATAVAILLGIKKEQNKEKQGQSAGSSVFRSMQLPTNIDQAAKTNPANLIIGLRENLLNVPLTNFSPTAIQSLQEEQEVSKSLPRSYYEETLANLKRIRDNAADQFNLSNSIYNDQYQRTVTSAAEAGKVATDEEFQLLDAFNKAIKGLDALLGSKTLFKSVYPTRIANLESAFDGQIDLKAEEAVREIAVSTGTTLERIALEELGDSSRWPEIVELNDLKPPYIVQDISDPTPNVKRPGDKLLIPIPSINGFSNAPSSKELAINSDLTEAEKSLGIDLKMTPEFDLEITNRGDLAVARGAENAAQAMVLKLSYEKGDLLKHPGIGVGINVGSKGSPVSDLKSSIIASLAADPRFEAIQDLSLRREDSTLLVKFVAKIKSVDIPVPITLKL